MKIKSVILDDEQHCIDTLQWQLEKYIPAVEVVETFSSPKAALNYLLSNTIELLFLDIEMPEINGFELLQRIGDVNFDVIFTTAYDEFALKAFRASAIDYLLKPISKDDLISAMKKVNDKQKPAILPSQIEILYDAINSKKTVKERIAVPTLEGLSFVEVKEIIYCISDSNYTHIYLNNSKEILVCRTLKEVEGMLEDNDRFLRIHHSHIINLSKIEKYLRGDGGHVIMDDSRQLNVSRSRKEVLLAAFQC